MKIDHIETLKKSGLKATNARLAILEYFQKKTMPVDVAEIEQILQTQKVNADQATVYRILNKFVESGILHRVEFHEGKFRYEMASLPHHHHAICIQCGSVQDIADCDTSGIEKLLKKKMSFDVKTHNLEFFGLCSKCQK